ncbi:DUF4148 domain-containing protein [Polaromonas naphthalenivorans]|uniref:DUF4148 domain-containing protein n=1 Tax=Polaromonas naphthalenivorans (strain CJ2) TaxID=365044 RepID=A1VW03_POLNA|nr:DUF4148 domain-containing protein [Polaromonas naphthalenivorans]ABM39831.1 hypothetical protein Pnap_4559 [Polaromonas naphthalenivorans CJ2]
MSIRKIIVALTLAGAALPAAFANSAVTSVGNTRDADYPASTLYSASTKTRAEVMQELQAFRSNPVTADGGKIVNTERGFAPAQHSYAFEGGALVHTDKLAHDTAKPSLVMTDADKRLQRELYRR